MSRIKIVLLAGVMSLGLISNAAGAEDYLLSGLKEDVSISANVAFYSQFLSRGFLRDSDPVVQTGVYARYKNVKLSVWGSSDMSHRDNRNSNRMFYMADYSGQFGKISSTLGYAYYDYTGVNDRGKEAYFGIAADVFLSPGLTVFYGWGDSGANNNGGTLYTVFSLAHSISLGTTPVSLDLSGYVAHNRKYYIEGESGGDALLSAALNLPLTKNLTVKPNVNYAIPFGDLEDSDDGNQEDQFYSGVRLSYSF